MSDHFIKHAVGARPLLLLLDGCSTHHQPEVVRLARSKQIILLCLPLHITHKSQPLDCTVFAPLKSQWRTVCHEFLQHNPGRVITKFNFNSFFSKAWLQSVMPAIIIAGFKSCGVYPFSSSAIKVPSLQSGSSNTVVEGRPPCSNDEGSPATEISSTYNDVRVDTDAEPSDFNAEQQQLYKKRFDEGYNLYIDPDYV